MCIRDRSSDVSGQFDVGESGGRPHVTTREAGYDIGQSGGRPHGTTREAGYHIKKCVLSSDHHTFVVPMRVNELCMWAGVWLTACSKEIPTGRTTTTIDFPEAILFLSVILDSNFITSLGLKL